MPKLYSAMFYRWLNDPFLEPAMLNYSTTVALPNEDDKPKRHPPPATPLSFPNHNPPDLSSFHHDHSINLQQLFATSNRLTTFTAFHVAALNLRLARDVPLDEFIPTGYLPPPERRPPPERHNNAGHDTKLTGPTSDSLRNGNIAYHERIEELLNDKEDVYAAIQRRTLKPREKPVRVAHFRNFFSQLLLVGEYWDTSLDSSPPPSSTSSPLANRDAMDIDELRSEAKAFEPNPKEPSSPSDLQSVPTNDNSPQSTPPDPTQPSSDSYSPPHTYTGYRTSSGAAMPPSLRTSLAFGFLTPILWAFSTRLEPPRSQSMLALQKSRIPVEITGLVYRPPPRRPQRGEPSLEGPLMALQCRHATNFESENAQVVDLLKEVGAMLLVAQLRAREGKEEMLLTKDEWFVTKPRFGGGTGEAVGTPLDASDDSESGEEKTGVRDGEEEPPAKRRGARAKAVKEGKIARRRKALEKSWAPPQKQWDLRVRYMGVGKEEDSGWDDVSAPASRISATYLALMSLKALLRGEINLGIHGFGHQSPSLHFASACSQRVSGLSGERWRYQSGEKWTPNAED